MLYQSSFNTAPPLCNHHYLFKKLSVGDCLVIATHLHLGKPSTLAAHLPVQTVCKFSLDTGNGFYVSVSVDTNMSKQKIKVASVAATGVLLVMTLLSLQSVFSCDKDVSGFQPRDDPMC